MKAVLQGIGARACAALLVFTLAGADTWAAPKYDDPVLTLGSTPDVVQKGTEADAYSLAVMAYNWGYPLVRMERTMREYVEVRRSTLRSREDIQ